MTNLRCLSRTLFLLGMVGGGLTAEAVDSVIAYADKPCTFSLVGSSFSDTQECSTWDDSSIGQWYGEGFFALSSGESLKAEKTGYTATWYSYPSQPVSAFGQGAAQATKQIGTGDTLSAATLQAKASFDYNSSTRKVAYVRWSPITYSISFDGGGATGGNTQSIDCTYDVAAILPQCRFTKTGYDFVGWATSPGGPVVYTDRESIQNLTYLDHGEVTLYASWQISSYTVTLDATGGSGGSGSVTVLYGANMPTARKPARLGYIFLGYWYHKDRPEDWVQYYDAEMHSQHTWEMERSSTLYAHWQPITYTLTLDGNGATSTNGVTQLVCTNDVDPQITRPLFEKEGVEFLGWGVSKRVVKYQPTDKLINLTTVDQEKITLYAIWSAAPGSAIVTSDLAKALDLEGVVVKESKDNKQWTVDENVYTTGVSSVKHTYSTASSTSLMIEFTRPGMVSFMYKGEGTEIELAVKTPGGVETNLAVGANWRKIDLLVEKAGTFDIKNPLGENDCVWVDNFVFTPSTCEIEVVADIGGKVSDGTAASKGSSLSLSADRGSTVTIQAEPDSGYEFSHWDGIAADTATVTFEAQEDVSAVAYFKAVEPNLTSTTDPNGVNLTWEKIAWAGQYVLYRSTGTQKPAEPFQIFNSEETKYTDTEGNSTTAYSYWLEARGGVQVACSQRVGGRAESTLASLSLTATKTTLKTGEKTTCICNAGYSDATSRTVSPAWSIASGSEYANITSTGEVTASNTTKQNQSVIVRAVYVEDGITLEGMLELTIRPTSSRTDGKYEVSVSYDSARGTVSGVGAYAPGRTVSLKATAKTGYVFGGWYDDAGVLLSQSATYRYTVKMEDVWLTARFASAAELMGAVSVKVGDIVFSAANIEASVSVPAAVAMSWDVVINSESAAKLTISGLPSGLKYKNGKISGVPSRGGKTSAAKLKLKIGKLTQVFVLNIAVTALPDFAVGTFTGGATGANAGSATFKITAAGKITGKWISAGKTWKLSANSFSDVDSAAGVYYADLVAKCGKVKQTLSLSLDASGLAQTELFKALWSNWKLNPWKSIFMSSVKNVTDTIVFADGVIEVKFSSSGVAKAKGAFGEYTASASSVLCPVSGQENVFALFLYFPPKTSRGVEFLGYAGWLSYVIKDGQLVRANAE